MENSSLANGSPAVKTKAERSRDTLWMQLEEACEAMVLARLSKEEIHQVIKSRSDTSKSPLTEEELEQVQSNARKAVKQNKTQRESEVLEIMNRRHAMVPVGASMQVMTESYNHELGRNVVTFNGTQDLGTRYHNKYIGKETWSKFWLSHPRRKEYAGLVFDPSMKSPPEVYNIWRGFSYKPKPGNCSLIIDHVRRIICGGNEEQAEYLLNWCAHMIQKPSEKPGVAIVVKGLPGCGKGTLANVLGSLVSAHYQTIADSTKLTGRFNAHFEHLILLFADEALWAGDRAGEGVLKALITEERSMVERKGQDSVSMRSCMRLFMASNGKWVAPVEMMDRRYFVLEALSSMIGNHAYFAAIHEQMNNGGYEAFLDYLLRRDIRQFNVRTYPMTAATMHQKMQSLTPVQHWWMEVLSSEEIKFAGSGDLPPFFTFFDESFKVPKSSVWEHFKSFCEDSNRKVYDTPINFGIDFKALVPGIKDVKVTAGRSRVNGYEIPSIVDCREHWDTVMKIKWDW